MEVYQTELKLTSSTAHFRCSPAYMLEAVRIVSFAVELCILFFSANTGYLMHLAPDPVCASV